MERLHQSLVFHVGRLESDKLARNSASSGIKLLLMSVGVSLEGKNIGSTMQDHASDRIHFIQCPF